MRLIRRFASFICTPARRFNELSPRQQITNGCAVAIGVVALFGFMLLPSSTNRIDVNDITVASDVNHTLTANDLRPEDCRTIGQDVQVTNVISGGEPIAGTAMGDMIFSDEFTATIDSNDGDDCIIAGPSASHVDGGNGFDVCIVDPAVVDVACEVRVDPSL